MNWGQISQTNRIQSGDVRVFNVSVVIPLYNKERFIRRTLQSALSQTLPANEIIIVNDSSTDSSVENIRDLIGGQVRLVSQPNSGPGLARNRGIAEAQSDWIAFLDADDLWRDDHLATLSHLSETFPRAAALAAAFERRKFDEVSTAQSSVRNGVSENIVEFFKAGSGDGPIWTSCVAIKRDVVTALGGFADICPGEDRELWVRVALDHEVARSNCCTAIYTQNTGGIMETLGPSAFRKFAHNPVFATLDRAISFARYEHKHDGLKKYRTSLLMQNVRQALYRGDPHSARSYIAEVDKSDGMRIGVLRILARLPAPVLMTGMKWRRAILDRIARLNPSRSNPR